MYIEVWLPGIFENGFTYYVPEKYQGNVVFGKRVSVPFQSKISMGVVARILTETPSYSEIKEVLEVDDEAPIINATQWDFFRWVSAYYLCPLSLVLKYALPKAFSLKVESLFYKNHQIDFAKVQLTDSESLLLDAMDVQNALQIKDIKAILSDLKNPMAIVQKMLKKQLIILEKTYDESYQYKKMKIARLSEVYLKDSEDWDIKIGKRSPKQKEIIDYFAKNNLSETPFPVLFKKEGFSKPAYKALEKKLLVYTEEVKVERGYYFNTIQRDFKGKIEQVQSEMPLVDSISFNERNYLNETDFYQKLIFYQQYIKGILDAGRDVLFLIPDMLLFPELYAFFQLFFPNQLKIYNNSLTDYQRVEVWKACQNSENRMPSIFLSTKEGVFLPFSNLGGLIVDNEEDILYKLQEMSPVFHARDMAFVLQKQHRCSLLLSSIIPSLEVLLLLKEGGIQKVEINKEEEEKPRIPVHIIDINKAKDDRGMVEHLSKDLIKRIDDALVNKKQVLVLKDKRGYASRMECKSCAYTPQCTQCSVNLTYHKSEQKLRCHKCGYQIRPSYYCNMCAKPEMAIKGYGTEKIFEELKAIFDKAKIVRLDRDTIQGKKKLSNFIDRFDNGEIDILIGTRLISKGLDLSNTSLFCVVSMDDMLNYPDFRVEERALQTINQISERLMAQNPKAELVLQTYQPNHEVIKSIEKGLKFKPLPAMLADRKKYNFPPYSRFISVLFRHKNKVLLEDASSEFYRIISQMIPHNMLQQPFYPSVERLRGLYQKQMIFMFPKTKDLNKRKKLIYNLSLRLKKHKDFRTVNVKIDVDPQYL
jgi:primosomal protein N' (replication factor Y)